MPKINDFNCTVAQRAVTDKALTESHDLFKKMVWLAIEAYESQVSLPHDNEDGERVVHGANRHVRYVAGCYLNSANGLKDMFPRQLNVGDEYFPYMYIRNRMGGHMPNWIARLVEKNGGVPPETWAYTDTSSN